jgi:hypothetical protein
MTFQGQSVFESVLAPALVLVIWSLLVWVWMYATRLPAIGKAGLKPDDARFPGSLDVLPDGARQVANNYNHLMEQPTIFYALAVITYLVGAQSPFTAALAWAYVGIRILHSLVQNTINRVAIRFMLFSLSTIALMVWAGCLALETFSA